MLYPFSAYNLINIHRQQLVLLILQPNAKWANVPVGAADRDHIYGTDILLQPAHPFPVFIIVHLFYLIKCIFLVASKPLFCYTIS